MSAIIVRKNILRDSNCLFCAFGYVIDGNKDQADLLRQTIASKVGNNPAKYSEAFLGMPNEEYRSWILNQNNRGGAIELSILAEDYAVEIAVYDIQTTSCHLYGQGENYFGRVMLIYDGLDYDALAMSPCDGAPEKSYRTFFAVQEDRTIIGTMEQLARNLVKELHRRL